jgi:hypothetical protein
MQEVFVLAEDHALVLVRISPNLKVGRTLHSDIEYVPGIMSARGEKSCEWRWELVVYQDLHDA